MIRTDYDVMSRTFYAWCDACQTGLTQSPTIADVLLWKNEHQCTPAPATTAATEGTP